MNSHEMTKRRFLTAASGFVILPSVLMIMPGRVFGQGMPTVEQVLFDPEVPMLGNPKGDVTIVEFFDYQCPYCKRVHPDVTRVVREDGKVRLVMKDWPIFGEPSLYASRLALAATEQGAHAAALHALMKTEGRLQDSTVDTALKGAGLDPKALQDKYRAHASKVDGIIGRNTAQARAFGLPGTPAFIVGTTHFPGVLDANGLRQALSDARKKG
ncbi:MAG: twin-arginine translocation pathway signal sequence domain-containing protein [Rhodospirillaceae bacterium]|nr:MAG: twin-arginine translocation pathway signal sequence domain-containing protein [Rhodospirillaceae bacterium]